MQPNAYRLMPCEGSLALSAKRPRFTVIEGGLHERKARKSELPLAIATSLLALVVFSGAWIASDVITQTRTDNAFDAARYETITVINGDSLWSIAESHPVNGCTTQQVVNHIREANGLSSACLTTGEQLIVPAED